MPLTSVIFSILITITESTVLIERVKKCPTIGTQEQLLAFKQVFHPTLHLKESSVLPERFRYSVASKHDG